MIHSLPYLCDAIFSHKTVNRNKDTVYIYLNASLIHAAYSKEMSEDMVNLRYYMHGTTDTCCITNHTLTDGQVEFISLNLPYSCRSLSLSQTGLTATGIEYLATNLLLRGNNNQLNLQSLCLYNTKLTDEGVRLLCRALIDGQNSKLHSLNVSANGKITDIGAHEISQMLVANRGLQRLDLSYNSIGRQGIFDVCSSLEMNKNMTLKYLDISFNLTLAEEKDDRDLNELLARVGERVRIVNY